MLRACAATVKIRLEDEYFPNAESVLKHDDVYVRAVIFEAGERYAILEADMPSMFPPDVRYCKSLLKEIAGVENKRSWIAVSHSFSAPHTWPLDSEQKDTYRPKGLDDPKNAEIALKINQAYKDAYKEAIVGALADMREARCGYSRGTCGINVNRNMETADGWWEGVNYDGYADHSLGVVRFVDKSGENIAVLYNYSMQVGVMAGAFPDLGGRVTSADVVGVASLYVENELGGTCMFLCGATGDQAPMFKCNYIEKDKDGHCRERNMGYENSGILQSMGMALGNAIMLTAQGTEPEDINEDIVSVQRSYICRCQKRDNDMHKLHATHEYKYEVEGTRELTVDVMILGDIAMVGLLPELDGITVAQIRDRSPYDKTIVSCFINGNAKNMPQRDSYKLFYKAAMNSPFAEGSAEQTRDVAVGLLHDIKNNMC